MKLPKSIRVVNRVFEVREMEGDFVRCCSADGLCDHNDDVIHVNTNQSRSQVIETLLHEVGHAINAVVGINDDSTEEEFVRRSTPIWMAVWRENPELFRLFSNWRKS